MHWDGPWRAHREAVLFDKSWFIDVPDRETVRAFALDDFSLPIRFAHKKDIPLEQRNVLLRRLPFWRALCGRPAWVVLFDHSPAVQKCIANGAPEGCFLARLLAVGKIF